MKRLVDTSMKKEPEATDALFAPLNYLILKQRNRSIGLEKFKGSSDPSHFTFEINVGKGRIRHATTLKLNHELLENR